MKKVARFLAKTSALALLPFVATAQEVRIQTLDGSVKLVGTVVSYDAQNIVVDTAFGQLSLPRAGSTCEGEACPVDAPALDLAISIDDPKIDALLKALASGFAASGPFSAETAANPNSPFDSVAFTNRDTGESAGEMTVSANDQAIGFGGLIDGSFAMNLTSSAVPSGSANNAISNGLDLTSPENERVIALDAIVPIVHPGNNVKSISAVEIAQIAGGRITNWSALGGDDAPINVLLPPEGSALDTAFAELVLAPNRVRLRRSVERADSVSAALTAVQSDTNAISFVPLGNANGASVLPIRQSCGPVAFATEFAIKAEEYPLTRRVYAYAQTNQLSDDAASFLDFLTSASAQEHVEASGYVDQRVELQSISLQGTRMTSAILSAGSAQTLGLVQRLAGDLATAERLSTTFRFATGSSDLDTKAVGDVQRVVEYLNSPAARNRDILVIGFTDDVGRFDLNERLSLTRAASVSDALIAANGGAALASRINVSSYGPLAPVGCNDNAVGRESNRRVEIWLR